MSAQKTIKRLVAFIIIANLVIIIFVFLGGNSSTPSNPLPNPNGYDDFVKAGQLLSGTDGVSNKISQQDLRAIITKNANALTLVRQGLTKQCRVPNDYSKDYGSKRIPEWGLLKQLGLALAAEGQLAELEHRTNDAATIYLDTIRFGQEFSRDGIIIVKLTGSAVEALGLTPLTRLADNLNAPECRQIAKTLEEIDNHEPPIEENLKQEKLWAAKAFGLSDRIEAIVQFKEQKRLKQAFTQRQQANQLRRRQVMLTFASRAYELDKGKPPQTISDLVPDYLKAIPQDPFTRTNMVIQP
ncbi:MAG: hypothetical protein JWQ71_4801 [Pedosphaera sp.]|nr:hypothetical protein [Pedosphaera sp.]